MARNTGAISRVYYLFSGGNTVTTQRINEAAQGDGMRRYRELVKAGDLTEISRRVIPGTRQLEITASR